MPHLYCDKTLFVLSLEGVFIWWFIIFLTFLYVLSYLIYDETVQMSLERSFKQFFRLGVVYQDQCEYELDKGDTTENRFTGKSFQQSRLSTDEAQEEQGPATVM